MKRVLFIITGSIAAKRCKEIMKLLDEERIQISCILTDQSKKYINIKEIKKFTKSRLFTDKSEEKNKMLHINLSRDNDMVIVCPASANTIAKFVQHDETAFFTHHHFVFCNIGILVSDKLIFQRFIFLRYTSQILYCL